MSQKPSNVNIPLIIAITVAIIGCLGTICAASIGAFSNFGVEQLRQQSELTRIAVLSVATQAPVEAVRDAPTRLPTFTELPAATDTPYPTLPPPATFTTEPPVIPTIDTRPTDTPPGTVLQVGETWTSGGFRVQLRSLTFAFGDEADLDFVLKNNTGRTLFFHFSNDTNVVMKDDLGRLYHWATPYEYDMIIENGSYDNLRLYKGGNFSGIQYLIVTVDLPNLIYAQWRN